MDVFQSLSNELRVPEIVENGSVTKSLHQLSQSEFISKHNSDDDDESSQEEYDEIEEDESIHSYNEDEESEEDEKKFATPVKRGRLIQNSDSMMLNWSQKKPETPSVPLPELPKFEKQGPIAKNVEPNSQVYMDLLEKTLKTNAIFQWGKSIKFAKLGDHEMVKSYVTSGIPLKAGNVDELLLFNLYNSTINYQYPSRPFSPSFSNSLKSILLKPLRFNTAQSATKKAPKLDLQTREKNLYLELETEWSQTFDNLFKSYFSYQLIDQFTYINCIFSVHFFCCKEAQQLQCIIFNCPTSFKNHLNKNSIQFQNLSNTNTSKFSTPVANLLISNLEGIQCIYRYLKSYKPIEIEFTSYSFPKLISNAPFLNSVKLLPNFIIKDDKLEFNGNYLLKEQVNQIQESLSKLTGEKIKVSFAALTKLNTGSN
jgi:hypothetical protein